MSNTAYHQANMLSAQVLDEMKNMKSSVDATLSTIMLDDNKENSHAHLVNYSAQEGISNQLTLVKTIQ